MHDPKYQRVVEANIQFHDRLADTYNTCEPHFRPENVEKVRTILKRICDTNNAKRLLDLGCGTGFLIQIVKDFVKEIHGVDVTKSMLNRVDTSGPAKIVLHNADTGAFCEHQGSFDVVTAYSFLHHLYDIRPTLKTAYQSLRKGGCFYGDLEPNYGFWEALSHLKRDGSYHPVLKREIEMVTYKDEDIEKTFGVPPEIYNQAEYGKSFGGGIKEEDLCAQLKEVGFREISIFYHWYIGQGHLINNDQYERKKRFEYASMVDEILKQSFPLSKNLYKYLGFTAIK